MTILALEVVGDATDAAAALDSVGASAGDMADKVSAASREADRSVSGFDAVGESADVMASRSAQAAGGLGDLGGALSLMPGPLGKVGAGMEALSPAIMGVTGASDLLNLVTQSTIVTTTRAKIASVAKATADKAQAVTTGVLTIAQRAYNAALAANPIGLVILAVVTLVGLFIVLYKRSETFRRIVQAVMRFASRAVSWVVDKVRDLVVWVAVRAVAAWRKTQAVAVAVWRGVTDLVAKVIDKVRDLVSWVVGRLGDGWRRVRDIAGAVVGAIRDRLQGLIDKVRSVIGWVRDRLVAGFQAFRDLAQRAMSPVVDVFQWLADKVDWIVDKIGDLKDLAGGLGGLLGKATGGLVGRTVTGSVPLVQAASTPTYVITIEGAIDPISTARQVDEVLSSYARRIGPSPVIGG